MNLSKKDFFQIDYYSLVRKEETLNVIQTLNDKEVDKLITPFLSDVVNSLYNHISTRLSESEILYKDSAEVDAKLSEVLALFPEYTNIDDPNISSKLFTNAFLKFRKRIFSDDGSNDEKYFLQSSIREWLEDSLAKAIVKDERFKTYEKIIALIEYTELLHHFYSALKRELPIEWINDDVANWTGVDSNPQNLLEHIRTFDKEYFLSYSEQLEKISARSPWKYINEATRFSDHAYFNLEYSFKSSVLFSKNISLWVKFWDNLKWPVFQDFPFHTIRLPEDFLAISNELVEQKDTLKSSPKHLASILMNNYFDNAIRIQDRLSLYVDEERIKHLSRYEKNEAILSEGKNVYELWIREKPPHYTQFIEHLLKLLTIDEIGEWVFSYSPRAIEKSASSDSYNSEIETLVKSYNVHLTKQPFDIQIQSIISDFNLQKFVFLVSIIDKDEIDNSTCTKLLNILIEFIHSEKFYWDQTFSPEYWPTLKGIGFLLSLIENQSTQGKLLMEEFKAHHEGWNITDSDYKFVQKECFVYCGAILLLEHPNAFKSEGERKDYFTYILNKILSQIRFAPSRKDQDYKLPLYMLNLVVNQVYKDMKEVYEESMIKGVDNVTTVIEILGIEKGILSSEANVLLKNRILKEIPFEKRMLLQRGQKNELVALEASLERLQMDELIE